MHNNNGGNVPPDSLDAGREVSPLHGGWLYPAGILCRPAKALEMINTH